MKRPDSYSTGTSPGIWTLVYCLDASLRDSGLPTVPLTGTGTGTWPRACQKTNPYTKFSSNSTHIHNVQVLYCIAVDINVDMDDVLKRIQSSRNVVGVMVINNEGIPLKSTLDSSTTVQYGGMISDLAAHAR